MIALFSSMSSGELGRINAVEQCIVLTQHGRTFCSTPYQAGPKVHEIEELEVQKQSNADFIKPATSEWASPVLFVSKKDEFIKDCINYRHPNNVTVKD